VIDDNLSPPAAFGQVYAGGINLPALKRAALLMTAVAALALSGCSKGMMADVTGSIRPSADMRIPSDPAGLRLFAEEWARKYDANPKDRTTGLIYARALMGLNRSAEAVAVLQGLAIQYPKDPKVLSAYGKSLADAGRLPEAAEVLSHADTPERPDWSVHSTRGTIADRLGNHEMARTYYEEALKIRPGDPTVLSNLGLSYALSRQLPKAEETLLLAAKEPEADMRVRQNLSLVLALEGKFAEAEGWSRRDLTPIDAAANIASIRQMISESNTWRDIQTGGAAKGGKGAKSAQGKTAAYREPLPQNLGQ